jgi:hypothetical protein
MLHLQFIQYGVGDAIREPPGREESRMNELARHKQKPKIPTRWRKYVLGRCFDIPLFPAAAMDLRS